MKFSLRARVRFGPGLGLSGSGLARLISILQMTRTRELFGMIELKYTYLKSMVSYMNDLD